MAERTCDYVARKDEPETWHGDDPDDWVLDRSSVIGGLEIDVWQCPHPPLNAEDDANTGDQYCVFHTDPENLPEDMDEGEEILSAIEEASPDADRPEHRGQFVGATFGAVDLSGETIATQNGLNVLFDHAVFRGNGDDLSFEKTVFISIDRNHLSFTNATFTTAEGGDVRFMEAMFANGGSGSVNFQGATFATQDGGDVRFPDAKFITPYIGSVNFQGATFDTQGEGNVGFQNAVFNIGKVGDVTFTDATLKDGNLAEAFLKEADFVEANLSGAVLHGTTLSGSDLREADLTNVEVNQGTQVGKQTLGERRAEDPEDWDALARAYHDLKTAFSEHGLVGKARKHHFLERRARGFEAKASSTRFNGWLNPEFLGSLASRLLTGYGVRVSRVALVMVILFVVSTAWYLHVGVRESALSTVTYSVKIFTTSPGSWPADTVTQIVVMFETFFGTLLIVLLGYILGNRERF